MIVVILIMPKQSACISFYLPFNRREKAVFQARSGYITTYFTTLTNDKILSSVIGITAIGKGQAFVTGYR